jgi:hypothetical protein
MFLVALATVLRGIIEQGVFMKIRVLVLGLVLSTTAIGPVAAATSPSPGGKCTRVGATSVSKGLKFTCVKKGKKTTWNSGVAIKTGKGTTTPAPVVSDSVSYKGAMIYDLKNGFLTRKANSGTYFETDSRSLSSFSAIRQKAHSEMALKSSTISHPNVEFTYDIRPSFPQALIEHSKRELSEAATFWNDFFGTKIKIQVYLVTEQDREHIKSITWLQNNLPAIFDRFDRKSERPFIAGGGGYWESNGEWTGTIFLATASYLNLTYVNYEWPQVAKHEFFHVVQDYAMFQTRRARTSTRAEFNNIQPQHFREGSANTIGYLTGFRNAGWGSDAMDWMVWQRAANFRNWIDIQSVDDVIRMMVATESHEPNEAFEMSYAIGSLMYEWVIGTYGREGFVKLLNQLASAPSFDVALQRSIGLTKSEFYSKSAPYVFSVFQALK